MLKKQKEEKMGLKGLPINPLEEKWLKEYPLVKSCEKIKDVDAINNPCSSCSKCPRGMDFKVSKEDLKMFRQYLKDCKNYFAFHNVNNRKVLKYDSRSME